MVNIDKARARGLHQAQLACSDPSDYFEAGAL